MATGQRACRHARGIVAAHKLQGLQAFEVDLNHPLRQFARAVKNLGGSQHCSTLVFHSWPTSSAATPFYCINLRLPKHLFPNSHTLRFSLNLRELQSALYTASHIAQKVHEHLLEHPP